MAPSALENLNCKLPVVSIPQDIDTETIFYRLQTTLSNIDMTIFTADALWRDMFALTGSIRTFYGADRIIDAWRALSRDAKPHQFTYIKSSSRKVLLGESNWIEGTFSFKIEQSPARICKAIVSLVPSQNARWRVWVFRTFIDRLQDHPSVDELQIPTEESLQQQDTKDNDGFECVVVGAGQAGLSVAGRLQSQGVKYILLEKNAAIGDSWSNRYKSTKLHTTRESSHLPFDRTFPPHFPQYLAKDDLARGYLEWAEKYRIKVWLSTTVVSGQWHDDHWSLELIRDNQRKYITTTHLVMAIGAGCQIPKTPLYPEIERFHGVIQHSANYNSAEGWQGKHGIVVGTANTAHDVAEDMLAADMASVTMIQRSPTYVLPVEYYTKVQNMTYNPDTPTEVADQMGLTNPLAVTRLTSISVLNRMAEAEPERFDALEKAGFKVIRYGDIVYQIFDRFGGHYMDVGASAKIAKGLINVKSDALPLHYTESGLKFTDGSELKADVIVFATGFEGNMKATIREILGSGVADRIQDFWGINEDGEIRGAFGPSGHPNLWMHGGTCAHARYMSRFIALQVRAALEGTPLSTPSL